MSESARPILFDVTRLLTRLKHPTPSGIDRVDLAYARHVFDGSADRHGVALTYFGARLMPERPRVRVLDAVADRWKETLGAGDDAVLGDLLPRLSGPETSRSVKPAQPRRKPAKVTPLEIGLKTAAFRWRPAAEAPRDAIYLHTSHLRLDRPELFRWLDSRPDIRPVFFVHDLIPIDFPEYSRPGEDGRHRVRMATIARHAAAVLANSEDVARRFRTYLSGAGLPVPPVTVAPLGAETPFSAPAAVPESARPYSGSARPYFVICSTIEARKNHLLLLQVWRELAERLGPETPVLVVVGRRGWESEAAIDLLDRCEAIRPHVVEASGLSTAGLAELVGGARALLMPSFAEGYGIPIVEALSVGTPVIASDIPVHREVAGVHATFLHPLDGPGWREAVLTAARAQGSVPPGYSPPGWDSHFRIVDAVLARL